VLGGFALGLPSTGMDLNRGRCQELRLCKGDVQGGDVRGRCQGGGVRGGGIKGEVSGVCESRGEVFRGWVRGGGDCQSGGQ